MKKIVGRLLGCLVLFLSGTALFAQIYTPAASNRESYCFNYDWKFSKANPNGAVTPDQNGFDDSLWTNISLPHTFNDVDTWREWIGHGTDADGKFIDPVLESPFTGIVWYRKHFKLDSALAGRKVFLEVEGLRNAGDFWVNGQFVGYHENFVGPLGLDISNFVNFGNVDNVISVKVNNASSVERASGVSFPWGPPFYPMYGGITKDMTLHVTDKLYQTLPLYSNLGTTGTYAYATNVETLTKTADIGVEAEVKNDYGYPQTVSYQADVVDANGKVILSKQADSQTIAAGGKTSFKISETVSGLHLWAPDYPYLYQVFTTLKIGNSVVDVQKVPLGVRTVTFNTVEGLKFNGHPTYLKGYAPRTVMDWPVIGMPQDWLVDYEFKLMKENNGNFLRPMHVAPRKVQVEAADRSGIIMVCPAANQEGDSVGSDPTTLRQWQMRLDVMRDVMIYYRNNPSVAFYEGSNSGLSYAHVADMVAMRNLWDPHGGKLVGNRGTDEANIPIAEYASPMDIPYSSKYLPVWDAEYARGECPRRVWDMDSPILNPNWLKGTSPDKYVTGGYLSVAGQFHKDMTAIGDANGIYPYPEPGYFRLATSEDLAIENITLYYQRWQRSPFYQSPTDCLNKGVMIGGAKIFFADSYSDGRMKDMEVARVSGLVDGARLPKEAYAAMRVAQNDKPDTAIMGHWNYADGTIRDVLVISNCEKVNLVTYDTAGNVLANYGWGDQAIFPANYDKQNRFAFKFANVVWQPGKIKAFGTNGTTMVSTDELNTVGEPSMLKLTPVLGPSGLMADGADIAMFDVEVLDAAGRRCPTDSDLVSFSASGAGTFLGGYNSGIRQSTYKNTLYTECGINRVFVRSTGTAGSFTLNVSRPGLTSASVTINSVAVPRSNGLSKIWPQRLSFPLGTEPVPIKDSGNEVPPLPGQTVDLTSTINNFAYTGTDGNTLSPPMPQAHIVHNGQTGSKVYVDKDWTFGTLPTYLSGGDYIQAFMRDASDGTSTDLYQFNVNKYCYVYQLIDAANAMPVHQDNASYQWTKLAETVVIGGRTHAIYKSRLMAPGDKGYFATNGHGITLAAGSNLYVCFAVSVESELETSSMDTACSTQQAANPVSSIVDRNAATRWSASDGSFPQYVKIDLGQICQIGRYDISWYGYSSRAYKYMIELSADDATYTLAVDKRANVDVGITHDQAGPTGAKAGRFVKLTITGSNGGWASLADFQLFGVPGGTVPPVTVCSAPTVSPLAGTYTSAQNVTISCSTVGASIRYTTDGSTPSATTGTIYTAPFAVATTTTIKAIAYKSGLSDSAVTSAVLTIATPTVCAAPVISPATGTYTTAQNLTIACATDGATIRYTTDGTTPSASTGSLYSAAFSVPVTTTIKAIAYKAGLSDSAVSSSILTIAAKCANPGIKPTAGPWTRAINVTITNPTAGATVHYTLDGSTPSATNGLIYSAPFSLSNDAMVKAIATASGLVDSAIVSASYSFDLATGTDLALGKTATSSSNENANLTPNKAVDGSYTTRWSSSFAEGQWIAIDLGSPQSISRVVLEWENAYGKAYAIQASDDGNTWRDIVTVSGGDGNSDDLRFSATITRFVRMLGVTRSITAYGFSLWNFAVYHY